MTRKFFHLVIAVSFISLSGCSMFSSEKPTSINEIEGEAANLEDVEESTTPEGDGFEDLDVETAAVSDDAKTDAADKKDSFNDIESFNQDFIEDELSDGKPVTEKPEVAPLENKEESPGQSVASQELTDLEVETAPSPVVEAVPTEQEPPQRLNKITNLEYQSQKSGGTVVITAEQPFEYDVREEPQFNQTIIEVKNVELAPRFKLPYIAKDFDQSVATINSYQDKGSAIATIVIQYKNKMKPNISMSGNSLMVMNSAFLGKSSEVVTSAAVGGENSVVNPSIHEKLLNIQLDDIDVKELIKLIAEDVGFNVIVDEDVSGKINNVKLNNVPWQEGFASILGAQGLAYERRGQIVRVARVEKLTTELTATKAKLEAEAGAKNAASSQVIKVIPVNYADITALVNQLTPVLTPTKGKATPDIRSNSIVIYDLEDNVKRAEQIIKSLDIKPIQVLVEGRIIEAKSNFLDQFGIQWTTSGNSGTTVGTVTSRGGNGQAPANVAGGVFGNVSFGTVGLLNTLSATLAVYESEERIKVLSSPRILTLNKEQALIRQSTQFPVVTATLVQGVGLTTATTFREAILQVQVTPQVTFASDMILDIIVDRDVPGAPTNDSVPINARKAQAKVLVKDGQTIVMGGILSMDETVREGGIPVLKDIPVLGYLFKSRTKTVEKNELVIFLQPKILNSESTMNGLEMSDASELDGPSQNNTNENGNTPIEKGSQNL